MPQSKTQKKNSKNKDITAVGRRKRAVARVRFLLDKKDWLVNGRKIGEYFNSPLFQPLYARPLQLIANKFKLGFEAKIIGGGVRAQIDALNHALARALVKWNEKEFKALMRENGFLTRDPREKERRKTGRGGKARRKRQSPKR